MTALAELSENVDIAERLPETALREHFVAEGHRVASDAHTAIEDDKREVADLETAHRQTTGVGERLDELQQAVRQENQALEPRLDRLSSPYVISDKLRQVVETAKFLEKPLLIQGEPGTGKTQLAFALAGDESLPIEDIVCNSTTVPTDPLYRYDDVRRLRDALLHKDVEEDQYVRMGPLGRAFQSDGKTIVLIDEIDKTKTGWEDNFLRVLEDWKFDVPETGETVRAQVKPIVIITSNGERQLSAAFRRRCVFTEIEFPKQEQMSQIVLSHFPNINQHLLEAAQRRFYDIRQTEGLEKKPSTSEFLDWIAVLQRDGVTDLDGVLPHLEVLLKTSEDLRRFEADLSRDEQLAGLGMSPEFVAKANGNDVIRLDIDYDGGPKQKKLFLTCANLNIPFQTPKYDSNPRNRKEFAITAPGSRVLGENWMALPKEIADNLRQEGLVSEEVFIAETNPDFRFSEVETANPLFTKGKNQNGQTVYRMGNRVLYTGKPDVPIEHSQT